MQVIEIPDVRSSERNQEERPPRLFPKNHPPYRKTSLMRKKKLRNLKKKNDTPSFFVFVFKSKTKKKW
jgi:hypothetical protein